MNEEGVAAAVSGAIAAAAAELRDELVALLAAGVSIPSVNPARGGGTGEGAFQDFLARHLERLGARVDVWEPDGEALAARYPRTLTGSTRDFRGRPNVVGVFGDAGDDGRHVHLILNSHADTVGADRERWRHDPFAAVVADGWLYGLGAADAKGCLLAFLGALRVLRHAGVRLARSLALESVVDEEAGGGGTLGCIARGYRAAGALVGEPTSLAVCPGSRGAFGLTLAVAGRSAHLGVAYDGVNAIDLALRYVEAFHTLRRDLDAAYVHPLWRPLPRGHVFTVTDIDGGGTPGAVPSRCRVRFSVGYMAGETYGETLARVEEAFARVSAADPWLAAHPPLLEPAEPFIEAAAAPADHPLVAALAATAADAGLAAPRVEALSAGTDGRFLTTLGSTPAVNVGPGEMARAHGPDEAIRPEEFQRAVIWFALAVARYCGVA
ncbi:MAG TPA: M20/M25/M40 family metallo-hydrolase [Thermomicrobiaceae bacterium]|nr:M20/M25/M40 family metallo-hydrolase [Thermomicrobiaceae bacterium]